MSLPEGSSPAGKGAPRDRWASGPYSRSRGAVRPPRPWYLRRTAWAVTLLAALAAVAVISDIPTRANRAQQIGDARSFVTEAYGYLDSCDAALKEAFGIEAQVAAGSLTSGDMIRVPDLLRDDNLACSYTNDDVYQLDSLTPPRSIPECSIFATAVSNWIVPDAYGATSAIGVLAIHPRNPAASAQLRKYDAKLTSDRGKALNALAAIDRELEITLPPLHLVTVPPGPPFLANG